MAKSLAFYKNKNAGYVDINSAMLFYYRSKTGKSTGSINDNEFAMLGSLGYTGSINDRRRAFYKAKTGNASNDINYLENLFYATLANDFA